MAGQVHMIEYTHGDILKDEAEALVNTVNCVGVMGRGIALQFKKAWPRNFQAYENACRHGEVQPGRMFVFETGELTHPRFIINFPTKRHWRGTSRIEDIESGLEALVRVVVERGIRSIALPPLGSGLGGLDWNDVRARIDSALAKLPDVCVRVYEPNGVPASNSLHNQTSVPRMTPGRAALVGLMHRYLGGLLDPSISLLEVHKLMYFMQEAGEPLKLNYVKAHCGPYAENLRHVLNAIEGHYIVGYRDGGDNPDKTLALVPGATEDANTFLIDHIASRDRFDRVVALVSGFESGFGMELLSTVHWILTRNGNIQDLDDVVARTHAWNERKQMFTPRQIGIAVDVLTSQGWCAPIKSVTDA